MKSIIHDGVLEIWFIDTIVIGFKQRFNYIYRIPSQFIDQVFMRNAFKIL